MKHVFVNITHMYDGLEFPDKGVYSIPDNKEPFMWAMENIARSYLDDIDDNCDPLNKKSISKWYSFEGGQHLVTVKSAKIITKKEFQILRNYM